MYRNYLFCPRKYKKTPSKVGYFSKTAEIISTAGQSKTSKNIKFCFIKLLTARFIYNDFGSDNDMSIWSSGGKKQLYPTQDRGTI